MTKPVDNWMPLFVDKYLGDTTDLTTEQHGAYLLLLMAMWKKDGVLPNNDERLRTITRLSQQRWAASRDVLREFFRPTEDGLGLTQKRLSAELKRSKSITSVKSEAGAKGAAKRWQTDGTAISKGSGKPNGKHEANGVAEDGVSHWQTGTPIPALSELPETASAVSARGLVGKALKAAGVDLSRVNLDDPRLTALIEQGATPAEFEGIGREAVAAGIVKPLGWICTALQGRREKAAGMALAPLPSAGNGEAERTAAELARRDAEHAAENTPEARAHATALLAEARRRAAELKPPRAA